MPREASILFLWVSVKGFWKTVIFELTDWIQKVIWSISTIQSIEVTSPQKTKRQRKRHFPLCLAETSIFPALRHYHSWFLDFWTQNGTYTIVSPGSQIFGFGLKSYQCLFLASILQTSRLWDFSAFIITWRVPHNNFCIYLCNTYLSYLPIYLSIIYLSSTICFLLV